MSEKVSIVIPAYNAKHWISQTINSAVNQNWPNFEVIIVDDGSQDGTFSIAKGFESAVVKVVNQENQGAASARNHGLSLAQGDYIQWLDADDLLAPDKISNQMNTPEREDQSVLLSSAFGQFYLCQESAKFEPTLLWKDLNPVDWIATKFANNLWMNPAVWLISRELTQISGRWDETLSLDDDGEYFCRVVANSKFVKYVPTAKCYYRQWNTGSLSRDISVKGCKSLLKSLTLSIDYLLSMENSERTRSAALLYLNIWAIYFYPEHKDMVLKLESLAYNLGGAIKKPKLSCKYELIRMLLGLRAAKMAMRFVATIKLWCRVHCERVF
jgi:glycosyltransferase involved in cell wall biosynthesis